MAIRKRRTIIEVARRGRDSVPAPPDFATVKASALTAIAKADVISALRFDPSQPNYGAVRGVVGASQRAANTTAINLAASDAASQGGTLILKGEYEISGTLTFRCHVDGTGAIVHAPANLNPAVLVGSVTPGDVLDWLRVDLPEVISSRPNGGGTWVDGTGVNFGNINSCIVTVPHIRSFANNVIMSAVGAGNCYNNYMIGHLNNGKVNQRITPGTGGWVNENIFQINRYSYYSVEGTNIPGARHIKVDSNGVHPVNNNIWLKPSIEGNAPQFHIEMLSGLDNRFIQGRYEAASPKVRLQDTRGTVFDGGYNLPAVQFTEVGSSSTSWLTRNFRRLLGAPADHGVLVIENQSSASAPAMVVMPTGSGMDANPATDYAWQLGTQSLKGKARTDAFPRFQVNTNNGRIYMGPGTVGPTLMIRMAGSGSNIGPSLEGAKVWTAGPIVPKNAGPEISAGPGTPEGNVSAPRGSLHLGANGTIYRKASGTGNSGWVEM